MRTISKGAQKTLAAADRHGRPWRGLIVAIQPGDTYVGSESIERIVWTNVIIQRKKSVTLPPTQTIFQESLKLRDL